MKKLLRDRGSSLRKGRFPNCFITLFLEKFSLLLDYIFFVW